MMALLDTGSTTNAVGEEVIVIVVNGARSSGLTPEDEAWPVKFERWDDIGGAGGITVGRPLRIIGAVLLPVMFWGRRDRMVTQIMRFKIFAKGTCGWPGLVIGGPSLEQQPLGLGLMACSGGHYTSRPWA